MKTTWRVSSNLINGKMRYQVYRLLDENEPDHSGNRKNDMLCPTEEEAKSRALHLNVTEDKTNFVKGELQTLVKRTDEAVERLAYDIENLEEYVHIVYKNGYRKYVLVSGNSLGAMAVAVLQVVLYS